MNNGHDELQGILDKLLKRDKQHERIFTIPEEGRAEEWTLEQVLRAARDSEARYDRQRSATKPGTIPDPIAIAGRTIGEMENNPNGVDRPMFKGAVEKEEEAVAMTAQLFGKTHLPEAGFLLSGGTESFNQAFWMARNAFYIDRLGHEEFFMEGIPGAIDRFGKTARPTILAPVNFHFIVEKAANVFGLGSDSIRFYDIDKEFNPVPESIDAQLNSIYEEGRDVFANCIVAGDTTHGKVHSPEAVCARVAEIAEQHGRQAPEAIIDAAGAYLFIGLMQENPRYDGGMARVTFDREEQLALIADPHKQEMPYSCGMLLLRDYEPLRFTDASQFANYIDATISEPEHARAKYQALAMIPTSRNGSNAFAVWSYYVHHGRKGMVRKKEHIWSLVKDFADFVDQSPYFERVMQPETQVVPFRMVGSGEENRQLYKRVKSEPGNHHISYDEGLLVRTAEELSATRKGDYDQRFGGLFTTFMEHNTPQGVDNLKESLEQEAHRIRKA